MMQLVCCEAVLGRGRDALGMQENGLMGKLTGFAKECLALDED